MYWRVMERVVRDGRTPYCSSETISGGVDVIVRSSAVLKRLYALGVATLILSEVEFNSYRVTSSAGKQESFHRVVVHAPRLLRAMHLADTLRQSGGQVLFSLAALGTYLWLRYLNGHTGSGV
jgi:hypothetical protein